MIIFALVALVIGIVLAAVLPGKSARLVGYAFLICSVAGFFLMSMNTGVSPYTLTGLSGSLLLLSLAILLATALKRSR